MFKNILTYCFLLCAISSQGQEILQFSTSSFDLDIDLAAWPYYITHGLLIQDEEPELVYKKYPKIKKIALQKWKTPQDTSHIFTIKKKTSLLYKVARVGITKNVTFSENGLISHTTVGQEWLNKDSSNVQLVNLVDTFIACTKDSSACIYSITIVNRGIVQPSKCPEAFTRWYKRIDKDVLGRPIKIQWLAVEKHCLSKDFLLDSTNWNQAKNIDFNDYIQKHYDDYDYLGADCFIPARRSVPEYSPVSNIITRNFFIYYRVLQAKQKWTIIMPPRALVSFHYEYNDTGWVEKCYIGDPALTRVRHFNTNNEETIRTQEVFHAYHLSTANRRLYMDTIYHNHNAKGDLVKIDLRKSVTPRDGAFYLYLNYAKWHNTFTRQEPEDWFRFKRTAAEIEEQVQEFEYTSFDERGNWTARIVKNSLYPYQYRRLEYYD
jgi:hypothetical protein